MTVEKLPEQGELVRSLASTIHKNMVAPSADRADIVNREIQQMSQKLAVLEKELDRLDRFCRTTRFWACSLAAGAALLSIVLYLIVS
ncbi:hypothetical protein ACOBQJ_06800 [Pelotomaculum propionicicum]|uniref:hypothetical protein n=1 Tax=Pelotomaculum propionicicum TaxID=258475 RepID=UPI003B7B2DB7